MLLAVAASSEESGMHRSSLHRRADEVALAACVLLLVDLFLHWERSTVPVIGTDQLQTGTSGWAGQGIVAGLLAIAVAILLARALTGHDHPLLTLVVCLAMLAAALVAVADGGHWPAWLGLGLAVVATGACLVADVTAARGRGLRTR
jgi:hypothetical protein